MVEERPIDEWRNKVEPVLLSKKREFEMFGYRGISCDDIWKCLKEKVWKHKRHFRLHEVVQDIFHLKIHTYMDYLSVNSLNKASKTKDDLMASIQAVMHQEKEFKE